MNHIQNYLLTIIGIGFLCAFISAIVPSSASNRFVTLGCGLLMLLTLIKPLANLDMEYLAESISRYKISETEIKSETKIDNKKLIAGIIKEKCETYIWDKAEQIGIEPLEIKVKICDNNDYPYPNGLLILCNYSEKQRRDLTQWVERELAIEEENQEWIWNERQTSK